MIRMSQLEGMKVGSILSLTPGPFLLTLWPHGALCVSKETELLNPKGMGVAGEALWSPQENPRHLGISLSREAARPHSGRGNQAKGLSGRWSLAGSPSPRSLAMGKFLASPSCKSLTFPLSSLSLFNCTHCCRSLCQSGGLGGNQWPRFPLESFPGPGRGWGPDSAKRHNF